ncbi:MAG: hypothetical protein H6828_02560 [Planctomycetes bacterium]|nr:hypothetical protein [Planctomycetota bacterium]
MLLAALALCAFAQDAPAPRVVIERMPAAGLGLEPGVARRDPSEVLRVGDVHVVFYTHVTADALHYPRSYAGTIWYATSTDEGHTWTERGEVLGYGPAGAWDELGAFQPSALLEADGTILLVHAGIGRPFNYRFEASRKTNPTYIGAARVWLDEHGVLTRYTRLGDEPLLGPTERTDRGFDSLQVDDPCILLRDGLYSLYYRARTFPEDADQSATGLALAEAPTGPYRRLASRAPALAFAQETFVWPFREGVLSLVTHAERGLYWAVDGRHFARVVERVEGSLNEPALAAAEAPARKRWGLHVARHAPDPYLERFELELVGDVPPPPLTMRPVPSQAAGAEGHGWLDGGTWLDQHDDLLAIARRRPADVLLVGDSITQGWGGLGRRVRAPGAAAFERWFGHLDAANYGISGDRTQHVLWRLEEGELARARARLVVLLVGTNNVGRDTPRDIAAGVDALLRQLRRALPQGEVLLLGLLPRADAVDEVRAVNALLADFAELPRVTWLDLAERFADADGAPRPELYDADLLHLSPAGYDALGEALSPYVRLLTKRPSQR